VCFYHQKHAKVFFLKTSQMLHLLQRQPQIFPYATMHKHTFYNVGYKEQKQSRFKKTNQPFIHLTKEKKDITEHDHKICENEMHRRDS
jgi:hypothetical protein